MRRRPANAERFRQGILAHIDQRLTAAKAELFTVGNDDAYLDVENLTKCRLSIQKWSASKCLRLLRRASRGNPRIVALAMAEGGAPEQHAAEIIAGVFGDTGPVT